MASSKFPLEELDVPSSLIQLSETHEVYCNLRPHQREYIKNIIDNGESTGAGVVQMIGTIADGFYSDGINNYLRSVETKARVVIFIQGFRPEKLCTIVVSLDEVWWSHGYPRLRFIRPEALTETMGQSNIWGEFVVAIAPVHQDTALLGEVVSDESLFISIVKEQGIRKVV